MKISTDDLESNGYVQLCQFKHSELIPFIQRYLRKGTIAVKLYLFCNIIIIITSVIYLVNELDNNPFFDLFLKFSNGLALSFLLIPVHEFIHGVAYRLFGAKNIYFSFSFKKIIVIAFADMFVASKKEFKIILLAPFIIISTLLLITLTLISASWQITILGILLTHTAMCSGDFGLLSYLEVNKEKQVITFDDIKNKTTFFYYKP